MPDQQEGSYPFYTYTGLLTPEHYQKIGSALWLFLWCVSSTTKEVEKDGIVWGIVKGNKPHKLNELAPLFNVSEKTVSRWIKDLEKHQYIKVTRAPYGLVLTVKNSKRGHLKRKDNNVHSGNENRSDENVPSYEEQTNLSGGDRTDLSGRSDKSVRCNKDELMINQFTTTAAADARASEEESDGVLTADPMGESASADEISHTSTDPQRLILDKFIELRGNGFFETPKDVQAAEEIVDHGVEINDALAWLKERFDTYKPRHNRDKIQSLDYCVGFILDRHTEKQEAKQKPKEVKPSARNRGSHGKAQRKSGIGAPRSPEESVTGGQVGRIRPGKRA